MTVKQLRGLLDNADDDATVVLYDAMNEGDTFCTWAAQVYKSDYRAYCQSDSITDICEHPHNKLFVLYGDGLVAMEAETVCPEDLKYFSRAK